MSTIRWLVLLSGVIALTLAVPTGGFSAISADRGVQVEVADDPNALLGIEIVETSTENGTEMTLLRVTDQFGGGTDVDFDDVSIVSEDPPISIESVGDLEPDAEIVVACDTAATDSDVTLRLQASGDGVSVDKRKTVTVTCTEG